jgi:hypothetical protein
MRGLYLMPRTVLAADTRCEVDASIVVVTSPR